MKQIRRGRSVSRDVGRREVGRRDVASRIAARTPLRRRAAWIPLIAVLGLLAACPRSVAGSAESGTSAGSVTTSTAAGGDPADGPGTSSYLPTTSATPSTAAVPTTGETTDAAPTTPTNPSGDPSTADGPPRPASFKTLPPATPIWGPTPTQLSAKTSAALFATAPIVIVASPETAAGAAKPDDAAAEHLADLARKLGAPALITPGRDADRAAIHAEIDRLGARWILAADPDALADIREDAARWAAGARVVADADSLPTVGAPAPVKGLALLMTDDVGTGMEAGLAAVRATAAAAGAHVYAMHGTDPRADPTLIKQLSADPPDSVLAIGAHLGDADRFAARVATAATGVQLPGGGQVMFPGRMLVALYGHPGSKSLGALGQQDLTAAIARAKKVAAQYDSLSKVPVIPSFEIIATVAAAGAGSDGMYSSQSTVDKLRPWVKAAADAGMYVILDLQPGRAHLLDQAKQYRELLEMPQVGLALDPEWKLGPGQRPLQQIGGVDASEVNSVISWLGELTAEHHLPQKVLVLHQFRLSMLRNESRITMNNDNVAVLIHMDGQGGTSQKEATWRAVVRAAPHGAVFGWKNFYVMDHPTMTPAQTMHRSPQPVMVSYQ